MSRITRRQFIAGTLATGAALCGSQLQSSGKLGSMSDKVRLGNTGITASYLALGTGTIGWNKQSNQTRLGTVGFARMVRHAFDKGINFFDVADIYGSHQFLRAAMTGVPRDKYVVQTKIWFRTMEDARKDLDRFLQELRTDYIDILMIHAVSNASWPVERKELMEFMQGAKEKKLIRAHGISAHGIESVKAAVGVPWVDVAMVQINHSGAKMNVPPAEAVQVYDQLKHEGKGIVGMKILGEGTIADQRQASLEYVCRLQCLDSIVIGFESTEQIDDVLTIGNRVLNAKS